MVILGKEPSFESLVSSFISEEQQTARQNYLLTLSESITPSQATLKLAVRKAENRHIKQRTHIKLITSAIKEDNLTPAISRYNTMISQV